MHRITTNKTNNHAIHFLNEINANPASLKEVLPSHVIEKHLSQIRYRERIFTPSVIIWSLLSQVLSSDQSCQSAVAKTIAHFINQNKKPPSSNTAAYCKARSRLPESILSGIACDIGKELETSALSNWQWKGRCIKLIDGSTVSMPDTIANQERYPQSNCQSVGIGFPIARIAAIISYATGAVLELAIGAFKGKETSELALIRQLLGILKREDVVVADSYYANYFMIALLMKAQVDFALPIHHARRYDFRKGLRLGKKDHVVIWNKPKKPDWMDIETYKMMPSNLQVREVAIENLKKGFRCHKKLLVTSFIDSTEVSQDDLCELYGYRWHVELDLRSIKNVMQMDILRGKTPQIVHKEVWAHVLAYNLIRKVMTNAALVHEKNPRQLSFKLTLQLILAFRDAGLLKAEHYDSLLRAISTKTVGNRLGRYEPRRIKRRPKPWDLLLKPRQAYQMEAI